MAISNQYTTKIEIKIGDKSNLKTLFHEDWRYFTVPSKTRKDWRHDEGEGTYAFNLSNDLLECYKNNGEIYNILESIKNECILSTMTISANKGTEDTDDNSLLKFNHYRCNISLLLLRKLKLLFISSYVHHKEKIPLQNNFKESMSLEFDTIAHTVTLKDIDIYPEDNIYLKYAREAATRSSFDSVFSKDEQKTDKVKNFYKDISPWYEYNRLEVLEQQCAINGEDIFNAIYMLFNQKKNFLYIGKADRLITRLRQHESNNLPGEPMREFTHFRYSTITEGYEDYIYLIENSAIHDLAHIFNMPNAKTYRSPLSKKCKSIIIEDIKITNTVEKQTKMNKGKATQ